VNDLLRSLLRSERIAFELVNSEMVARAGRHHCVSARASQIGPGCADRQGVVAPDDRGTLPKEAVVPYL